MLTLSFDADELFLTHDLAIIQLEGFPSDDFGLPIQLRFQPVKSDISKTTYRIHIEKGRWRYKNQSKNLNQIYFMRRWEIDNYSGCISNYTDCNKENPCLNCRNMAAMENLNQDCSNEDYYEKYKNDVMSVLSTVFPHVEKKLIIECNHYETKNEVLNFI